MGYVPPAIEHFLTISGIVSFIFVSSLSVNLKKDAKCRPKENKSN